MQHNRDRGLDDSGDVRRRLQAWQDALLELRKQGSDLYTDTYDGFSDHLIADSVGHVVEMVVAAQELLAQVCDKLPEQNSITDEQRVEGTGVLPPND